jgi:hypothetical protein
MGFKSLKNILPPKDRGSWSIHYFIRFAKLRYGRKDDR